MGGATSPLPRRRITGASRAPAPVRAAHGSRRRAAFGARPHRSSPRAGECCGSRRRPIRSRACTAPWRSVRRWSWCRRSIRPASWAPGCDGPALTVAVVPDEWAAAAGGVDIVIGARTAAWAPCPGIAAAVVIDEHDEALQSESSPTWHARDVVIERCRRADVPVVVVSPCPTVSALHWRPVTRPPVVARARGMADPRRGRPIRAGTVAAVVADVDADRLPP